MIGYFLYKVSEVLLKAIIQANRENRKGIQSHTVILQWVASSQNMPPSSGKECSLLRHQQFWQMWAGRKLFSRVHEEMFNFLWRDFYGGLEKCCIEIKHVFLSICPEAKWVQGYFIAWETKLFSPGLLKYSIQSSHDPEPSPLGMTGQSLCICWFPQ